MIEPNAAIRAIAERFHLIRMPDQDGKIIYRWPKPEERKPHA